MRRGLRGRFARCLAAARTGGNLRGAQFKTRLAIGRSLDGADSRCGGASHASSRTACPSARIADLAWSIPMRTILNTISVLSTIAGGLALFFLGHAWFAIGLAEPIAQVQQAYIGWLYPIAEL